MYVAIGYEDGVSGVRALWGSIWYLTWDVLDDCGYPQAKVCIWHVEKRMSRTDQAAGNGAPLTANRFGSLNQDNKEARNWDDPFYEAFLGQNAQTPSQKLHPVSVLFSHQEGDGLCPRLQWTQKVQHLVAAYSLSSGPFKHLNLSPDTTLWLA